MSDAGKTIVTLSTILVCAVVMIIALSLAFHYRGKELDAAYRTQHRLRETHDQTIRMVKNETITTEGKGVMGIDYDKQHYVYHNYNWFMLYEVDGKYMEEL